MASWMVHLRIAEALLPRLEGIEETAFVVGNIAPDNGVPNADWTEFRPPKTVTHFETKIGPGSRIDTEAFCSRYFNAGLIGGYSEKEYSFFLGYYAHLLTDIRWAETIYAELKRAFAEEYAKDRHKLVETAKEDWYDLDYRYLEQHPDFRAFAVYENAVGFENVYMDEFSADAFENRRQFICAFYHEGEHGDLYRAYRYLTPERVDAFVKDTAEWVLERMGGLLRE